MYCPSSLFDGLIMDHKIEDSQVFPCMYFMKSFWVILVSNLSGIFVILKNVKVSGDGKPWGLIYIEGNNVKTKM